MTLIARNCLVCGARTEGTARCPAHQGVAGRRASSCAICGTQTTGRGWCPDHDPHDPNGVLYHRPWRVAYAHPSYRQGRNTALARAGYRCEERGCGSSVHLEADHVIPLSTARTFQEAIALNRAGNLMIRCRPHHAAKTNATPRRRDGR